MGAPAKVVDELLCLPRDQRADLAMKLINSLHDEDGPADDPVEVAAAWAEEIDRRIAERDAGRSRSRPLDEAVADIRTKLAADRKAKAR
jgi:putative addiction module component (TIGR02574 family)